MAFETPDRVIKTKAIAEEDLHLTPAKNDKAAPKADPKADPKVVPKADTKAATEAVPQSAKAASQASSSNQKPTAPESSAEVNPLVQNESLKLSSKSKRESRIEQLQSECSDKDEQIRQQHREIELLRSGCAAKDDQIRKQIEGAKNDQIRIQLLDQAAEAKFAQLVKETGEAAQVNSTCPMMSSLSELVKRHKGLEEVCEKIDIFAQRALRLQGSSQKSDEAELRRQVQTTTRPSLEPLIPEDQMAKILKDLETTGPLSSLIGLLEEVEPLSKDSSDLGQVYRGFADNVHKFVDMCGGPEVALSKEDQHMRTLNRKFITEVNNHLLSDEKTAGLLQSKQNLKEKALVDEIHEISEHLNQAGPILYRGKKEKERNEKTKELAMYYVENLGKVKSCSSPTQFLEKKQAELLEAAQTLLKDYDNYQADQLAFANELNRRMSVVRQLKADKAKELQQKETETDKVEKEDLQACIQSLQTVLHQVLANVESKHEARIALHAKSMECDEACKQELKCEEELLPKVKMHEDAIACAKKGSCLVQSFCADVLIPAYVALSTKATKDVKQREDELPGSWSKFDVVCERLRADLDKQCNDRAKRMKECDQKIDALVLDLEQLEYSEAADVEKKFEATIKELKEREDQQDQNGKSLEASRAKLEEVDNLRAEHAAHLNNSLVDGAKREQFQIWLNSFHYAVQNPKGVGMQRGMLGNGFGSGMYGRPAFARLGDRSPGSVAGESFQNVSLMSNDELDEQGAAERVQAEAAVAHNETVDVNKLETVQSAEDASDESAAVSLPADSRAGELDDQGAGQQEQADAKAAVVHNEVEDINKLETSESAVDIVLTMLVQRQAASATAFDWNQLQ